MLHELRRSTGLDCDDGLRHGHRLDVRERTRIVDRRQQKDVGGGEDLSDVRPPAGEEHMLLEPELGDQAPKRFRIA